MNSFAIFDSLKLPNGLYISVSDKSRVYFGDYFIVRLELLCTFEQENQDRKVEYKRILEKMAVPSKDVKDTQKELLDDFIKNSLPYFESPDFPELLLKNKLSAAKFSSRKFLGKPL